MKNEAKRPYGVLVFGCLILIGSGIGALGVLLDPGARRHVSFLLFGALHVLSLFAAVFLLRLRNWARQAILVLAAALVVGTIVVYPGLHRISANENWALMRPSLHEHLLAEAERDQVRSQESLVFHGRIYFDTLHAVMMAVMCWNVGFNAAVLWYFSRPRVKERFT